MGNHKYAELALKLRSDIRNGVYSDGERLPSENELVSDTGYSRQTIRQAIGILENEGIVSRIQGSGTYVRKAVPHHRVSTNNIAVVTTYIGEYIFPDILYGINQVLSHNGYTPLLYATGNRVDNERRILTELLAKPIDGLIVEGTKTAFPNPNIDIYDRLSEMGIPVVFINGFYNTIKKAVYVVADDRAGGRMACENLINKGCRKIAGIFKSDDIQGHFRYAGYSEALRDAGIAIEDHHILWYTTENRDIQLESTALKVIDGCDAVVCYNDEVTLKLLKLLGSAETAGLRIASFDNSTYAQLSPVPFVSLSNPKSEIGSKAAKKMVNILNGKAEQNLVLPWKLE